MNSPSRLGMRLLKGYVVAAASLVVVATFLTLLQPPPASRFEEINVERLNVVEKDGRVRLVVSNKERFPGLMVNGEEHPYPRGVAGIVFIDEAGNEYGTLATHTRRADQDFGAYSGLQFGNAAQGQIGMIYDDDAGQREAGLFIAGASADATAALLERGRKVQQMPEGPDKVRAMAELRRREGPPRVTVARMKDQSATVALADPQGNPRLRLVVDANGDPRVEFLDAAGSVIRSLGGSSEP
jgi:hypothetical protein